MTDDRDLSPLMADTLSARLMICLSPKVDKTFTGMEQPVREATQRDRENIKTRKTKTNAITMNGEKKIIDNSLRYLSGFYLTFIQLGCLIGIQHLFYKRADLAKTSASGCHITLYCKAAIVGCY